MEHSQIQLKSHEKLADIAQVKDTLNLDSILNKSHDTKPNNERKGLYKKLYNTEAQSNILRTPHDTGSKYDAGYINQLNLKDYRATNRKKAIYNNIEFVEEILGIALLLIITILVIRFVIRRWSIIRKFFIG